MLHLKEMSLSTTMVVRDELVDNNGCVNSIIPIIPWSYDLILHYLTQPVYGPISLTYVL